MISDDSYDELSEALVQEQERLLREGRLSVKEAVRQAARLIAQRLGVDTRVFLARMREIHQNRAAEDEPIVWSMIGTARNRADLERREWWRSHPDQFEAVLRVLFEHDPIRICNHARGPSEYSPEVNTLLPRLLSARSEDEVAVAVLEEFRRWFGPTADRSQADYSAIAKELWALSQRWRAS